MADFNATEAIKAQRKYCEENKSPHFAPNDGRCWNCKQNIYLPGKRFWKGKYDSRESEGISVEEASNELVTGCPHCYRSYSD